MSIKEIATRHIRKSREDECILLKGSAVHDNGDMVNHPKHYNHGIETIDYIESHNMNFNEGNVIKYVTRHRYKNGLEDLKKAKFYLEREIYRYENEEYLGTGETNGN